VEISNKLNQNQTAKFEHRWSDRCQVDYPVKIFRNGQHLINSAIADISLEGIFIGINEQRINPNTYIEVEFNLANKNESIPYRLPALIRHSSDKGVGAMFLHFSTGTFRHFHRILYNEPGIRANSKRLKARWSPRKNISLNLSLYQNGKKIADASTSNLSFEGVFINTTLSLPLYSSLTVEFSLSDDDAEQTLQVPCLVRHRNNSGIGLMFINFQLDKFNYLRHRLHDHNSGGGYAEVIIPEIPLLDKPVSINSNMQTENRSTP